MSITTGHENILEPLTLGGPMQQATVNQFSTDFHLRRFYFGSSLFSSKAAGCSTQGKNIYGGRRIGQRFEVNANHFESNLQSVQGTPSESTTVLSGTVRENFSSRLLLRKVTERQFAAARFSFAPQSKKSRQF